MRRVGVLPTSGPPISHSNLAPSSSGRPVFLVSKETGNQTQRTYLMGSSTQLSDPHVMGLDFSFSKTMMFKQSAAKQWGREAIGGHSRSSWSQGSLSAPAPFLVPWRRTHVTPTTTPRHWFRHWKSRSYPKALCHCTLLPLRRGEGKERGKREKKEAKDGVEWRGGEKNKR